MYSNSREKSIREIESNPTKVVEIRGLQYKHKKITVTPQFDKTTNDYIGIPANWEELKKTVGESGVQTPTSQYVLEDGARLDLTKKRDLAIWNWLKYKPQLALNIDDAKSNPKAAFVVFLEGKEEIKEVSRIEKVVKAQSLIMADSDAELAYKAKLITGEDLSSFLPAQVKKQMYLTAQKNPDLVLKIYADPDLETRIFIEQLKQKQIIYKYDGIYKYGEVMIGTNEDTILEFMKRDKNADYVRMMNIELNSDFHPDNSVKAVFESKYRKPNPLDEVQERTAMTLSDPQTNADSNSFDLTPSTGSKRKK